MSATVNSETAENSITLTRIIDAPIATAYHAWTDPRKMAQWWGPKDFTNPVCELDVIPGGEIRIDMTGPDGTVYPMGGIFHEIIEPQKLVFTTTAFQNDDETWELEVFNTITFYELDGKTKLTVQAAVIKQSPKVAASVDGMEEGWNQSLDRLAALISK